MNKSLFAFFSMVILSAVIAVHSDVKAEGGKVVMIIADYLDIEDIGRMEYLRGLTGEGYVALVNNRQPGKAGASKSKLIIGSGKRLELNTDMVSGGSGESHLKLYRGESGREPLPDSLVYTDIYRVKYRNSDSEYLKYIGYIGDAVNRNNGSVCYIGNADGEEQNRSSMLIGLDSSGGIDSGETEDVLLKDDTFPGGIRTDYNRLAELYKQYLPASSFMVIETGDMERLEAFKGFMRSEAYEACRQDTIKRIDGFIKKILEQEGCKTLIFISTYPSESNSEEGDKLTPLVVYEGKKGGVLYSDNTRREGIILNTDIADYILFKLGYLSDCAVCGFERKEPLEFLDDMNANIVRTSVLRAPVLTHYAVLVIVALGVLFVTGYLWPGSGTFIAYAMLCFPIAFLFIPAPLLKWGPVEYTALSAAVSLILPLFLHKALKDRIKVILSICLLLQTGLAVDILTGSILIKQSVLGYDPIIGARFYGIGNEYAGMFIGCSLIVFGCIMELRGKKCSRAAAAAYFLTCTSILGLTFLGANFGGALAGAFGYLLAYFLVFDIKFNRRNVFTGVLMLGLAAAALIAADSLGLSRRSHMGGLVEDAQANGFGVVISTIKRKVSMNLRLMRYTIWTKVLLCIIGAISIMFYKPVKQMCDIFRKYKYLRYSWMSIAASAAAGFAVNDSGIVVAATSMIFTVFTMLIMRISERNEGEHI